MVPVLLRCFIQIYSYGRHIAHIARSVSFRKCVFALLHDFRSNGSLLCEGSFAHTCTKPFFKGCHNHCLKWVLKGFLSQGLLQPLFSRNAFLVWTKYKSHAMLLHLFQNTEYCIHSRLLFDTQTFTKYYCIYWGILCQSNVALSWRNAPPCWESITIFNGAQKYCYSTTIFWIYYLLFQMNPA